MCFIRLNAQRRQHWSFRAMCCRLQPVTCNNCCQNKKLILQIESCSSVFLFWLFVFQVLDLCDSCLSVLCEISAYMTPIVCSGKMPRFQGNRGYRSPLPPASLSRNVTVIFSKWNGYHFSAVLLHQMYQIYIAYCWLPDFDNGPYLKLSVCNYKMYVGLELI